MKKYIMFTNCTAGIGGAELYILRKAKWLKAKGFDVIIITGKRNPILIEDFNQFEIIEIQELYYPPNIFAKNKVNSIMNHIISICNLTNKYTETFIESHQTSTALWAEIFAKIIKTKNIIYMLAPVELNRKIYKIYFVDKLFRNELLGCNKSYLKDNFSLIATEGTYNNNYFNIPFDADEIQKTRSCTNKEVEYDLNILTVSRIDKKYIIESVQQAYEFAQLSPYLNIKYEIYVDKTNGKQYDELYKLIKSKLLSNLKIILNGPVFPLNDGIYKDQDVFLGMGTSIINSSAMRVPSLVIDYRNNKYYGYFGHNYYEFGASNDKATYNFSEAISMLIADKENIEKFGSEAYKHFHNNYENNSVNEAFLTFMEKQKKIDNKAVNVPSSIMDIRDIVDYFLVRVFDVRRSLMLRIQIINLYLSIKHFIKGEKN